MIESTRLTVILRPGDKAALDELQAAWDTNASHATFRALRLAALLIRLAGDGPIRIDTPNDPETVRFL